MLLRRACLVGCLCFAWAFLCWCEKQEAGLDEDSLSLSEGVKGRMQGGEELDNNDFVNELNIKEMIDKLDKRFLS